MLVSFCRHKNFSCPLGDLSLFLYRKKRDSSADCSSFLSRSYCVLTLEYITAIHMGCQCSKDVISWKINVVEFSSKLYSLGLVCRLGSREA